MIWEDLTKEDWEECWLLWCLVSWVIFLATTLELVMRYL